MNSRVEYIFVFLTRVQHQRVSVVPNVLTIGPSSGLAPLTMGVDLLVYSLS